MNDGTASHGHYRKIGGFVILALVAVATVVFFKTSMHEYFTLEYVRTEQAFLTTNVTFHPVYTVSVFIALYVTAVVFSLPIASVLSISAGFLFGVLLGMIIVVLAATIGAVLAFIVARYFFRDWVLERFAVPLHRINTHLKKDVFPYILFLRLVPLFPFFLVNIALAVTRVPIATYALATILGIIPGTLIYVLAGQRLATITTTAHVFSVENVFVLLLLGGMALAPLIIKKYPLKNVTI